MSREQYQMDNFIEQSLVSVVLRRSAVNRIKMFKCFNCGNHILQYQGEVVAILPDLTPNAMPVIVKCGNKHCGVRYHFHIMVR